MSSQPILSTLPSDNPLVPIKPTIDCRIDANGLEIDIATTTAIPVVTQESQNLGSFECLDLSIQ
jgi:hypothetical protein